MAIEFSTARWDKVREDAQRWWAGELKRPLLQITSYGHDPHRTPPQVPPHRFISHHGLDVPPSQVIDAYDYDLSTMEYLGDAFPHLWLNFGAGVAAAFMGAAVENRPDTTWFHPPRDVPIDQLDFQYDPGNLWLQRVKEVAKAASDRWDGLVQVGQTDLGGDLDIVASFRTTGQLLTDLCTDPDQVKRLSWQVHDLWWRYYSDIDAVVRHANPGYTAWAQIFSTAPYYIFQCDFCYMIGPDMFEEFVRPELVASCRGLTNGFYHLDGVGQLAHLDSLLRIDELKGIQWVPGDGKPSWETWVDVYRKIRDAGKRIQVWGPMSAVDRLIGELGSGEGIVAFIDIDKSKEADARAFLDKYGV